MKKSIALVLALLMVLTMALTSCDLSAIFPGGEPKDDPQANVSALVETINANGSLGAVVEEVELPETEDITSVLDEISFEADGKLSGTTIGDTPVEAGIKINDRVFYINAGDASEGYYFVEDDLNIVAVGRNGDGEFSAEIIDDLKLLFEQLAELETEDMRATISDMLGISEEMLDTLALPEITSADVEYTDGRYLLKNSYIEKAVDHVVDTIMDYAKSQGSTVTEDDVTQTKESIKDVINAFNPTLGFTMKNEKITGVYFKLAPDAESLGEYVGETKRLFLELELSKEKMYVDFAFENDFNMYDVKLDVALEYDDDDDLKKADASFELSFSNNSYDYIWEYVYNETYDVKEYVTVAEIVTENLVTVDLDMTLDLEAGRKGGTVLDLDFTLANEAVSVEKCDPDTGEELTLTDDERAEYASEDLSVALTVDWTAAKNGTSELVADLNAKVGETTAHTLKVEIDFKHTSDMTPDADAVAAKNAALAEQE